VTVREVAELVAAGLDTDIAPELPGTYRMGDIRHCFADPTRAEELLGFKASVRLEDGMGELLDWVRTQTATDRVEEAAAELVARRLVR
jgi:dTDP-L-rhamnose 4-epimerase